MEALVELDHTFDAFVSYSRSDSAFAKKLEAALERYRAPRGLGLPKRRLNVFRDITDLTGNELSEALVDALRRSKYLIVVCSPEARASRWVGMEIDEFARWHGKEGILPVLLSGKPNHEVSPDDLAGERAFHDALYAYFDEPLAADFRAQHGLWRRHERRREAKYQLLATLYGVAKEKLIRRQQRRQLWGMTLAASVLMVLTVVFLAGFVWATDQQLKARKAEQEAEQQRVLAEAEALRADRLRRVAEAAADNAERQRALAEAEALRADRLRQVAEAARDTTRAVLATAQQQRQIAEEQRRKAEEARLTAEDNARMARLERQRALATLDSLRAQRNADLKLARVGSGSSPAGDSLLQQNLALAREALGLYRRAGSDAGAAQAHDLIGDLHFRLGSFEEAIESHRTALGLQETLSGESSVTVATTFEKMGDDYVGLQTYADALAHYDTAFAIQQHHEADGAAAATIWTKRGAAHYAQAHYDTALTSYAAAWNIWAARHDTLGQVAVLRNLARTYDAQGKGRKQRRARLAVMDFLNPLGPPSLIVEVGGGYKTGAGKPARELVIPHFHFDIGLARRWRLGTTFAVSDNLFQPDFFGVRAMYRLARFRRGPLPHGKIWASAESLRNFDERRHSLALHYERGLFHYTLRYTRIQKQHEKFFPTLLNGQGIVEVAVGINAYDLYRLLRGAEKPDDR